MNDSLESFHRTPRGRALENGLEERRRGAGPGGEAGEARCPGIGSDEWNFSGSGGLHRASAATDRAQYRAERGVEIAQQILLRRLSVQGMGPAVSGKRGDVVPRLMRQPGRLPDPQRADQRA